MCKAGAFNQFMMDETDDRFLAWTFEHGFVTFTQWWIS
jgi:hypothetical protein